MSTETIALLTILRDETQSRDVHARCVAEIKRMEAPPRSPFVVTEEMSRAVENELANRAVAIDSCPVNRAKVNGGVLGIDRSVYSKWVNTPAAEADVQIVRIK